jgi:spore coat protein CotH
MTTSTLRLFVFAIILLSSCTKKIIPDVTLDTSNTEIIPTIKPKGTENYLRLKSDYIYDQNKVKTFNLIIKTDDLYKLNNDPAKEEYVPAALVFEGDTISPVGVRYKGSIGAYIGCVSGTDWSKPSGYKTCVKLSMQVKINWEGRQEKLFDLNKLQFHSQNYDKAQLRERLGYWLFAHMGVPAPRSVHARLLINGQYSGLYGLTEEVDNRFAEYSYKEGNGNIYKEVWPLKANGDVQTDKAFIDALKTNEDKPNVALIKEFGQAFATSTASTQKDLVKKYMDINRIMSYVVVDRVIRHDDGPFHWYCGSIDPSSCGNHNFYWFEDQKNKKMHLIPWDLDGAFEHIVRNTNNVTPIIDKWGDISNNCVPLAIVTNGNKQRSAACDKLTAAWVSFDTEYNALRKHFQEQILTDEKTINQIDIWAKQIEPFVREADGFYNGGSAFGTKATNYITWESAVTVLKNQIKVARVPN